jgi:hypothetical protein
MQPHWLMVAGWVALALGLASAFAILIDEFVLGNQQQMWVMNLVHPITALYFGPVWLWAYVRNGRKSGQRVMRRDRGNGANAPERGADRLRARAPAPRRTIGRDFGQRAVG